MTLLLFCNRGSPREENKLETLGVLKGTFSYIWFLSVPVPLGRVTYTTMLSGIICGHVHVRARETVTWTILRDHVLVSNAPVCVASAHAGEKEMFFFIKYTDICIFKFTNVYNIYIVYTLYYIHL